MNRTPQPAAVQRMDSSPVLAFAGGAAVGVLGGLVGLGGAEFRLPLLLAMGAVGLGAVIMNKVCSLAVVVAAVPARLVGVPLHSLTGHWSVVVNVLVGSLVGAWVGATWATRMSTATLYRVLAVLLVLIAAVFTVERAGWLPSADLSDPTRVLAGVVFGFGVGVVAAILGVAGGELLIPGLVLLFAVDVKLAGSLSLLISLPTMLVAFFRYSRDQAFSVLSANSRFVLAILAGSVTGSVLGGLLVGVVPAVVIVPILSALLLFSAVQVWRHARLSSRGRASRLDVRRRRSGGPAPRRGTPRSPRRHTRSTRR